MSDQSSSKSLNIEELEHLRAENAELKKQLEQLNNNLKPLDKHGKSTRHPHYLEQELYNLIKEDSSIFDFFQRGSLDGLWYWDLENPEHEWMSPEFWHLFGYAPEEKKHLASEWQDMIFPDDLKTATDNFNKHCADPSHPYDQPVRYRHKDGSTVWVRCRGIVLKDKDGKPIRMIGAHNDITKLKIREQDLANSERRYRLLAENIRDIIWQRDADLNLTYISPSVEKILGFTPQEAISAPLEKRFTPESLVMLAGLRQELQDAIASGQADSAQRRLELEALHKNGQSVWLEVDVRSVTDTEGHFLYLIGVSRDITDRKRIEISVYQQTSRIRNMFDNVPVGMFESTPEGKFIYVNHAIAKMLKYPSPEVLIAEVNKSSIAEVLYVNPELRPAFVEETGGQGSSWKVFETRYRCQNNEIIDALLTFAHAPDPVSGDEHLFGFVLDITEQKRAEKTIAIAKVEFESIFNNSQVGIMLLKNGRFLYKANQRLANILGYESPDEMVGMNTRSVHLSEDAYKEFGLNRAEGPIEAFPGRNREKVDFKDGANGDSLIAEA